MSGTFFSLVSLVVLIRPYDSTISGYSDQLRGWLLSNPRKKSVIGLGWMGDGDSAVSGSTRGLQSSCSKQSWTWWYKVFNPSMPEPETDGAL